MKKISLLLLTFPLVACVADPPAPNPRNVMDVGGGKFYVEASRTSKAIAVAQSHCAKLGKKMNSQRIVPHTMDDDAAVTFICE